jgi:hypothetical protein
MMRPSKCGFIRVSSVAPELVFVKDINSQFVSVRRTSKRSTGSVRSQNRVPAAAWQGGKGFALSR